MGQISLHITNEAEKELEEYAYSNHTSIGALLKEAIHKSAKKTKKTAKKEKE